MELASRDVISRAEQTEIDEGRGIDGNVLLDLRHLGTEKILERLHGTRELSMTFAGVDPIFEPIPVRHLDIRENQVGVRPGGARRSLREGGGGHDLEASLVKEDREHVADRSFVRTRAQVTSCLSIRQSGLACIPQQLIPSEECGPQRPASIPRRRLNPDRLERALTK